MNNRSIIFTIVLVSCTVTAFFSGRDSVTVTKAEFHRIADDKGEAIQDCIETSEDITYSLEQVADLVEYCREY